MSNGDRRSKPKKADGLSDTAQMSLFEFRFVIPSDREREAIDLRTKAERLGLVRELLIEVLLLREFAEQWGPVQEHDFTESPLLANQGSRITEGLADGSK